MKVSKRKFGVLGTACAMLAMPVVAAAGDGPYVGVEGGGNYESNQNFKSGSIPSQNSDELSDRFKSGFVGGVVAGYSLPIGFRPELEFDFRRNQIRKLVDVGGSTKDVNGFDNAYTGFANLWYDVKTDTGIFSVVHPYIGGGVGIARVDIRKFDVAGAPFINDFTTKFAYQGGAGLGFDVTRHLTVSADWRFVETDRGNYKYSGVDENVAARYNANSAMIGVRYSFGADKPAPVAYVPPPVAYAPPPPPVAPIGDSDGDGVPDNLDKCPGTPHGFKVDADGCIIEQSIVLRGINFEFNKDQLTVPAQQTLDEVAAALVGQPTLAVQIDGYTDSKGSPAYNLKLSDRRAASVRRYLISKGVASDNLVSKGYGESNPIATNDTDVGRTENRRVEFKVLNKPSTVKVLSKDSTDASKAAAGSDEPAPKVKHHHRRHKAETPAPAAQ